MTSEIETNTMLAVYSNDELMETHHKTVFLKDPDEILRQLDPSETTLSEDQRLVYFEHSR